MEAEREYVEWFRNSAPYINAHRGGTFVVQFGGEAVCDTAFNTLVHDIALLDSLGIKLVLVHGARPQIEAALEAEGGAIRYHDGTRITDEPALRAVKRAAGEVRLEIEALLSMGLANSPMAGARIRAISGNFVTARPVGIHDGVDFRHTGEVRRVDAQTIRTHLDIGEVVIISPIGFSPTGEMFNLSADDIATAVAVELRATKLIILAESSLVDDAGRVVRQLTLEQANTLLARRRAIAPPSAHESTRHLRSAVYACRNGVRRTHLVERGIDGGMIAELFTRDGIGTMVSADLYDDTRRATIEDVGGVLELIGPLEESGMLVRRSREKLESEIDRFLVMERDGTVIACAALYPIGEGTDVELACVAVHNAYRNSGRGEALLETVEREARRMRASRLFVLTTQTTHWFREHGFAPAAVSDLPVRRQALYNWQRNSKVLMKALATCRT